MKKIQMHFLRVFAAKTQDIADFFHVPK